jgi:alpha 1,3-glucosidase
MNEPSVFTGPEGTMPKGNQHGDAEHRDLHNLYGMLMMKSTFNGLLQRSNNTERPFVLTRSFFAGTQKYGAIWTGDNTARWEYLEYSIPMVLSVALGGVSMCGADVGGFFGDPEPELLVRWYQLAAFIPFYRGHSSIESKRREPWLFGEPYTSQIRESMNMRYAMLPYIYTLFSQYHRNGTPVIRPLFLEFPLDNKAAKIDNQFLLGSGLMIAAVTKAAQQKVDIYLPEGKWYDYHTFTDVGSGEMHYEVAENWVPSFIKGGNIVPRQDRVRSSTVTKYGDPYTFIVALDENEEAEGSLYIDDAKTHNYQQGEFLNAEIKLKEQKLQYTVTNSLQVDNTVERIVFVGIKKSPDHVLIENRNGVSSADFIVEDNVLVVKLAEVQVNEDWVLTIN